MVYKAIRPSPPVNEDYRQQVRVYYRALVALVAPMNASSWECDRCQSDRQIRWVSDKDQ